MSAKHDDKESGYHHLTGAAWAILAMGISLAIIVLLWIWFGHVGPANATSVLEQQQNSLRQQYGLPPAPIISPQEATIPPSLRNVTGTNSTGQNATAS
jgi:hypothetical protein